MNSARAIQFRQSEISAAATVRNSRTVQMECSRVEEHLKKMGAVWQ